MYRIQLDINDGNLTSYTTKSVAKVYDIPANVETIKDENDMKVITGVLQACINDDGEESCVFFLWHY